ncbi:MAG TPA: hypothetical protein VG756_31740 [Pseudonocardiaceae bacterium]|nr:hypothetical protein [Pseudonocardiaceae bacterium]
MESGDSSLPDRRWPRVALGVLLLAASGAWLAVTLSWTMDALGGHTDTRAVITMDQRSDGARRGDARYTLDARTDSGSGLDLGVFGATGLYAAVDVGDPVVVTRSTLTGDLLAVRSANDYVSRLDDPGLLLVAVVLPLVLPVLLAFPLRRLLSRTRWWVVLGVPALAFAVTATVLLRAGPALPAGGPHPPPAGQLVADRLPETVVAARQPATVGNVSVVLTGPPTDRLPAGAAPWLAEFTLLVIGIRAQLSGPGSAGQSGQAGVRLAGDGVGAAEAVGPAACTHRAGDFGDVVSLNRISAARGTLCFVLPSGFRPHYLVLADPVTGASVAIDLTGIH